jgi:hypothetical protein
MQATELLEAITAAGGRVWLDGDKVRARLPENLSPLVPAIRDLKPELIELLSGRPAMSAACARANSCCSGGKLATSLCTDQETTSRRREVSIFPATHPAMPAGVRLVEWRPKAAPVQLSECSTVIDTEKFIRTTLQQLQAALEGESWLSGGWGLSGLLARLEACGCVVALEDVRKALQ